ncbi:MAG: sialidase family protein [Actinomycetes bacterium]
MGFRGGFRHARLRTFAGLGMLSLAAAAAPALAVSHPQGVRGPFEVQLTHDARYAEGEPSIAVNPRNPRNIILTFLANTGLGAYAVQNQQPPSGRSYIQTIQGCDFLRTFDGGRSWQRGTLPLTSPRTDPVRTNCSDTLVQFDANGVAYVIGGTYQFPAFAAGLGDFRMISSRDGGRTWSAPSVVTPTYLSPHSNPIGWKGLRFYDDREFMALDPQTHTLYVDGTQGRATANGPRGDTEYLTASDDGGKTWRNALAVGVAAPSPLGAAYGIVAFTSPPPDAKKTCASCFDFIVSTDGARTFVRRPSPVIGSSGLLSGADTVADPSVPGRFDVLTSDSDGNLLLYRTGDAGRTWSAPTTFGVPGRGVSKTWMAYSPSGVLGVGWRSTKGKGYGFYGAVSYDHGSTFTVRRISAQDSPPTDPLWVAGDDTSTITLTQHMFYASWGDWRGGSLQTWWGGFPI